MELLQMELLQDLLLAIKIAGIVAYVMIAFLLTGIIFVLYKSRKGTD